MENHNFAAASGSGYYEKVGHGMESRQFPGHPANSITQQAHHHLPHTTPSSGHPHFSNNSSSQMPPNQFQKQFSQQQNQNHHQQSQHQHNPSINLNVNRNQNFENHHHRQSQHFGNNNTSMGTMGNMTPSHSQAQGHGHITSAPFITNNHRSSFQHSNSHSHSYQGNVDSNGNVMGFGGGGSVLSMGSNSPHHNGVSGGPNSFTSAGNGIGRSSVSGDNNININNNSHNRNHIFPPQPALGVAAAGAAGGGFRLQQNNQYYHTGVEMGSLSNPLAAANFPDGCRPRFGPSRDEMKDRLAESLAADTNISCLPGFKTRDDIRLNCVGTFSNPPPPNQQHQLLQQQQLLGGIGAGNGNGAGCGVGVRSGRKMFGQDPTPGMNSAIRRPPPSEATSGNIGVHNNGIGRSLPDFSDIHRINAQISNVSKHDPMNMTSKAYLPPAGLCSIGSLHTSASSATGSFRKGRDGIWSSMGTPGPCASSMNEEKAQKAGYRKELERQIEQTRIRKEEENRRDKDINDHPLGANYAQPKQTYMPPKFLSSPNLSNLEMAMRLTQGRREDDYTVDEGRLSNKVDRREGDQNRSRSMNGSMYTAFFSSNSNDSNSGYKPQLQPQQQRVSNGPETEPRNVSNNRFAAEIGSVADGGAGDGGQGKSKVTSSPLQGAGSGSGLGNSNSSSNSNSNSNPTPTRLQPNPWNYGAAGTPSPSPFPINPVPVMQPPPPPGQPWPIYGVGVAPMVPFPPPPFPHPPPPPFFHPHAHPLPPPPHLFHPHPPPPPSTHLPPQCLPPSMANHRHFESDGEAPGVGNGPKSGTCDQNILNRRLSSQDNGESGDMREPEIENLEQLKDELPLKQYTWQTSDQLPDPALKTLIYKEELRRQIMQKKKDEEEKALREKEEEEKLEKKIREYDERMRREVQDERNRIFVRGNPSLITSHTERNKQKHSQDQVPVMSINGVIPRDSSHTETAETRGGSEVRGWEDVIPISMHENTTKGTECESSTGGIHNDYDTRTTNDKPGHHTGARAGTVTAGPYSPHAMGLGKSNGAGEANQLEQRIEEQQKQQLYGSGDNSNNAHQYQQHKQPQQKQQLQQNHNSQDYEQEQTPRFRRQQHIAGDFEDADTVNENAFEATGNITSRTVIMNKNTAMNHEDIARSPFLPSVQLQKRLETQSDSSLISQKLQHIEGQEKNHDDWEETGNHDKVRVQGKGKRGGSRNLHALSDMLNSLGLETRRIERDIRRKMNS